MVLHRKTVSHTERDCYGCVCVIRHCLAVQADALRLLPMSLRSIGGKEPPFHGAFDCVFFFCSARWLQIHRTHVGMRMEVSVVICVLWFWVIWEWVGVNKEKKPRFKRISVFLCWGIRTRTRKGRTRICSVTITPYPNFVVLLSALQLCFSIASAKVRSFFETTKFFADFF